MAELKEGKRHLRRKILYFTNFHVLWNLEKIIFLWVSFKFPVISEILKYMHLIPKGALKWNLEMTSSWGSLCNNDTTIQTPETQSNGNKKNSQHACLQFSLITPFTSLAILSLLSQFFWSTGSVHCKTSRRNLHTLWRPSFGFIEDGCSKNDISFSVQSSQSLLPLFYIGSPRNVGNSPMWLFLLSVYEFTIS